MRNMHHARCSINITPCGSVQFWLELGCKLTQVWWGVGGNSVII